jgi:hypothetical protein
MYRRVMHLQTAKQAAGEDQVDNRTKDLHCHKSEECDTRRVIHGHLTVELSGARAAV